MFSAGRRGEMLFVEILGILDSLLESVPKAPCLLDLTSSLRSFHSNR